MTNDNLGRWLLVAIAIVGLAVAFPAVSAHGNETTAEDAPTENATADDWATWMEDHMSDHMGSDAVEWMESHMGVTVDEMARDMADGDYHNGTVGHDNDDGTVGHDNDDGTFDHDVPENGTLGHDAGGGMGGQGHC